jgi:hypothetical protein
MQSDAIMEMHLKAALAAHVAGEPLAPAADLR